MSYFKQTKDIIYVENTKRRINIIQISDLHYSDLIKENDLNKIANKIKELKPDYITITGDTIDNSESISSKDKQKNILSFFGSLASITTTIISLGNHDFYKKVKKKIVYGYQEEFWNKVKKISGIHLLDNEIYRNEEIEFFGYTQPKEYYFSRKNEEKNINVMCKDLQIKKTFLQKSSIPKIALIHSPSCITNPKIIEKLQNFNLILSGHMHNGCVFPIIDELWKSDRGFINPSKKIFPNNCRGRIIKNYNNKTINIIISGALTTFSKHSPRLFHPLDNIFPYYINQIIITNDEKDAKTKSTYKYYK